MQCGMEVVFTLVHVAKLYLDLKGRRIPNSKFYPVLVVVQKWMRHVFLRPQHTFAASGKNWAEH